jgi:3-dehydroquinate dehydratase type I
MTNFCLPILSPTKASVEQTILKYYEHYSTFEIWLEYISDLSLDWPLSLAQRYPSKLLFVLRRLNLEEMQLSDQLRNTILESLITQQVLVDLDVTVHEREISEFGSKLQTVLSYHNYTATPSDLELRAITDKMAHAQGSISKIATLCQSPADGLRLLQLLLHLKHSGRRSVVLGMGHHGLITRIFGAYWGNELNFAPPDQEMTSAPGQLTLDALQKILALIPSS